MLSFATSYRWSSFLPYTNTTDIIYNLHFIGCMRKMIETMNCLAVKVFLNVKTKPIHSEYQSIIKILTDFF